ncbi:hypothetical protein C1924_17945 [Stenotrophomonas sp. ESTM1D_MKCIP4_1]|uniref:biopolymer transporter ExbD n=1 Tax=Stenotrophomonas sp. ESTM1D_MKCIP4_1 TaxID=2072414 RepID=UPI000D53F853|nr:biopolymer transporter ExbD [Stenotrophomonas sp. ESTM1D_MKCIP4_1]AWH54932.1 hypothetical protein C1924_17945 [Stenotrophomonas sp. ESTM1D_MKCIP4_1]
MAIRLQPGDSDLPEQHEINVTPFIDVMLVLLIVFMVAAPLATVSVAVDLPSSRATPAPAPEQPLVVVLQADGGWQVQGQPVAADALRSVLQRAAGPRTEGDAPRVFLQADRRTDYATLVAAMDSLREAGFGKVALVAAEQGTP